MPAAADNAAEPLDALLWRRYGSAAALPAVLAANPGLADYGPVLPLGLALIVPAAAPVAAPQPEPVRLWS